MARRITGPAVDVVTAPSVPMIDPSLSSGITTMPRTGQSLRSQTMAECDSICCRPVEITCSASERTSGSCWSAPPSQPRVLPRLSVMVSAQVSSSWRR